MDEKEKDAALINDVAEQNEEEAASDDTKGLDYLI